MSQPTPPKNQTPDQTPTDPSTQKAQTDEIGGPKGLELLAMGIGNAKDVVLIFNHP